MHLQICLDFVTNSFDAILAFVALVVGATVNKNFTKLDFHYHSCSEGLRHRNFEATFLDLDRLAFGAQESATAEFSPQFFNLDSASIFSDFRLRSAYATVELGGTTSHAPPPPRARYGPSHR